MSSDSVVCILLCSLILPGLVSALNEALLLSSSTIGESDLRSKPLVDLLLRVTTGLPKELQPHLVSCDLLPELPELAAGRELQLVSWVSQFV